MTDIEKNHGALLVGGFLAIGLSGIVTVQVITYYRLYRRDSPVLKCLVAIVWVLDLTHSGLIIASVWNYLIANFGDASAINHIPGTLSLTVIFTAILTFFVHCFLAHRIFMLSRRNWLLVGPILFLAACRLGSAAATSAQMIRLQFFSLFKAEFKWLFSLGLAISSVVDIIITISLFALLQRSRTSSINLDQIIDTLILYSFETGSLTCAGTILSLIFWLSMNTNLIFMGLHFIIGKLYATSLLASLNTRDELRRHRHRESSGSGAYPPRACETIQLPLQRVQVDVEKSIIYDNENMSPYEHEL